ncbi:MAG TPA: hypothetical protein VKX25_14190 [Bryobacteraceae bacterium]|jgi:threonine/homoserine/homoserine lactone efflux protein|nr:hypothetical protein [Bryobacteraceae bacterium]
MSRTAVLALAALAIWICWCVLVLLVIVPAVRRHITMWPGFLAYMLSLLPVIIAAAAVLIRLRRDA